MTIHTLHPLRDPRWTELVERHPRASVFHTVGWLEALRRTYGYEAIAYTTSPPGAELENGIVFCEIRSWLTGRRLVSLPFSDHCEPLVQESGTLASLLAHVEHERRRRSWRYVELRPLATSPSSAPGFNPSKEFYFHLLDLRPEPEALFRNFHKDSIQRKIRRAERERLSYEAGHTDELLKRFYRLLVLTRRRHQLPPQPFAWFRNLAACLGDALTVHIASHNESPVAGIMTVRHRDTMVYKYGASDSAFHALGGMHLLFWNMIQQGRNEGCTVLDLGRSDLENDGLRNFKNRWGATLSHMHYWHHPARPNRISSKSWSKPLAKRAFSLTPDLVLIAASKVLYKHIA